MRYRGFIALCAAGGAGAALLMASLIAGCDQHNDPAGEDEPQVALNCPTLPKAEADALRSVKILDFDGTRLFIPNGWIKGYFDDGRSKAEAGFRAIVSSAIAPAINSNECPGLVHHFAVGARATRHGSMSLSHKGPVPRTPAERKAAAGSIVQIAVLSRDSWNAGPIPDAYRVAKPAAGSVWARGRGPYGYVLNDVALNRSDRCTISYDDIDDAWFLSRWVHPTLGFKLTIQSEAPEPDPNWGKHCARIEPLLKWLTTSPQQRSASFDFTT